jgi:hypothetical protein
MRTTATNITLVIAGDFCPTHRLAAWQLSKHSFADIQEECSGVDIRIANLECPVTDRSYRPISKTGPTVRAGSDALAFLTSLGFNTVTLANNHIFDFGRQALADTIANLRKHEMYYVGAGLNYETATRTKYFTIRNQTLAIVNIAENEWSTTKEGDRAGAHSLDPVKNYYAIRKATSRADYVVVIAHGGHELYPLPSPRMKELFHFFIDIGADAVINHHPHCPSGWEVYRGKPIYYSLGNFLFDNPAKRAGAWTRGLLVRLTFAKDRVEHSYKPFTQCSRDRLFEFDDVKAQVGSRKKLEGLTKIIEDDSRLKQAFVAYCAKNKRFYLSRLEPLGNEYFRRLRSRGILPGFMTSAKKRSILNLIRCEAHRDVLMRLLANGRGSTE